MKNTENIEQLFKEKFKHFEADVNPKVWAQVQHGIHSAPAGGTAASAAKFTIGKIIAGAASVAAIAGSVWYFTASDNKTTSSPPDKKNQTEISSKDNSQNNNSENHLSGTTSNSPLLKGQTAATLPGEPTDRSTAVQNPSEHTAPIANNEVTADASDNSSLASQPAHKYGNAPQGPSSINRGSLAQYSQPKSQNNNNSSADNQEAEQAPVANIFASTESGDVPLTVTFSNQGIASSLSWDFGDGSATAENAPSHTFDKPGNYTVKLSAKNSAGNASDKVTIEVKAISSIEIPPNIFTPNNDGNNDYFFLRLKNIASIEMVIQDMTDMHIVYKSADPEGKWDGKNLSGADAHTGKYWWRATAVGIDGITYEKFGIVELGR